MGYRNYTKADYLKILSTYETCGGINETARLTKFPRTTVHRISKQYTSVENFQATYTGEDKQNLLHILKTPTNQHTARKSHYAYTLGMYLGDGHISKTKSHRAHRLMIYLDRAYPNIIEQCRYALSQVFTGNKINVQDKATCVAVGCYSQQLPDIFPQDGDGKKHEREIQLEQWQQRIIDTYPLDFFRGLYHSDGSRSQNWVNGTNYPRYTFSNVSDDIRKLFTDTAEKLGLHWTTANARNVAISRRPDVAWLDEHIGEKA